MRIVPAAVGACILSLVLMPVTAAEAGRVPQAQSPPVIENPAKPAAPNPGRVLPIKEVLRIKDEGTSFFFKEPWGLDVAPDGSIFVIDGERLMKFKPDGKFERNFIRAGQGPGEITSEIQGILFEGNEISIFSSPSNKIVVCGPDGRLIREIRFRDKTFLRMLGKPGSRYAMLDSKLRDLDRSPGLKDRAWSLFFVDASGTAAPTGLSFSTKELFSAVTAGGRVARSAISTFNQSVSRGNSVYVSCSQEYLLEEVDLEKAVVTKSFRRAYPRVKYVAKDPRDRRPMPEYENDVHRLLVSGDMVWAVTSTFDPKKGALVDVFDAAGKFRDSFILPIVNSRTGDAFFQRYFPLVIRDGFLYAAEHDADWNWSIAKYELPKL